MEGCEKGTLVMGIEIERKFLVKNDSWRLQAEGIEYRQGYLNMDKERTVRVRTIQDKGFLAVKGITKEGTRTEYEYQIPVADAETMLDEICEKPLIEKNRYKISIGGVIWEVDEFFGENEGLIVAEVELGNKAQVFDKPAWIGEEVTGDPIYFNSNLIKHPYSKW
jgi:adenylate cyclase